MLGFMEAAVQQAVIVAMPLDQMQWLHRVAQTTKVQAVEVAQQHNTCTTSQLSSKTHLQPRLQ